MLKVVADEKIPFLRGALENVATVLYLPGEKIAAHHLKNADALIIRTRTICNRKLLEGSAIKFIATATIGYDHIDTDYCKAGNIHWANAPGCNSGSVKQYIASSLSYIIKNSRYKFDGITLGIIGVGNVGKKVEKLAGLLGIRVLLNDPPRQIEEGGDKFQEIDYILAQSDIITLHVPLIMAGNYPTYHLANENFFSRMKRGSLFINTSRGEVTETKSLINALKNNHLAGAIIDVWENEPNIDHELLNLANIATPHIAGYSVDGKAMGTAMSVRSLSRYFGLGLDNWKPVTGKPGAANKIVISDLAKTPEELFSEVSLKAYNIKVDSDMLKMRPEEFERFRGDYPPRYEPENLKIKITDNNQKHSNFLKKLGYRTVN